MKEQTPRPKAFPGRRFFHPSAPAARCAFCLTLLLALPGGAQMPVGTQQFPQNQPRFGHPDPSRQAGGGPEGIDDTGPSDQDRQARALNIQRQKAMVSDAKKLLKLAKELEAEVTAMQADSLDADQLQKLAEIEKLAHSVKDKMSTAVQPAQPYQPPGMIIH